MRKIICILVIIISILGTSAYASDSNILKLDEAIGKGIENSKKLEIDRLNISSADKLYKTVQEDADSIFPYAISKTTAKNDAKKRNEVYTDNKKKHLEPMQRKLELDLAKKTEISDKNAIVLDVYNSYYGLIQKDNDIKIMEMELLLAKDKYKDALSKYTKGVISKNEYRLEYLNSLNAQLKLNSLKRTRKKEISKLYYSMNDGYNPSVKELDNSLIYDTKLIDIEDALKSARENRNEIFEATKIVELKEKEFEIIKDLFEENTTEYKNIVNDLEEAKLKLKNKKNDVDYEIRTVYNELLNMLDTIEVNKREVEIQKMDYDTIKLKQELGMATLVQVLEKQIQYQKALNTVDKSIMDYIIAKVKFELSVN